MRPHEAEDVERWLRYRRKWMDQREKIAAIDEGDCEVSVSLGDREHRFVLCWESMRAALLAQHDKNIRDLDTKLAQFGIEIVD